MKLAHIITSIAMAASASGASAFTVGHYNSSKESYGLAGSYIGLAKQSLIDKGYTLTSTGSMDATFLAGVDAVYIGLMNSTPSATEISALQQFVDVQGGFLFIQTDWTLASWTAPANAILSNWGIAHGGTYSNDTHVTVGSSEWVSNPNVVNGFIGSVHSIVTSAPADFEVLGRDSSGHPVLGVFDAGAGRSSDVLIATDINFWSDGIGWTNAGNRNLWDNIWQAAATQTSGANNVPEPSSLALLGVGVIGASLARRRVTA